MRRCMFQFALIGAAVLAANGGPLASHAVEVRYEIRPAESYLRIVPGVPNPNFFPDFYEVFQGTRFATTMAVITQRTGSLQSALQGNLVADRVGNTLTFQPGSFIDAQLNSAAVSSDFSPSAAATGSGAVEDNYGGRGAFTSSSNIVAQIALRDVAVDILGGSATIGSLGTGLSFGITDGVLDFDVDPDTASLVGLADPTDYLFLPDLLLPVNNHSTSSVTVAGDGTLTIPFALDYFFEMFDPDDSRLVLQGVIVATPLLAGDYNNNRVVDAADYTTWRDRMGTTQLLANDPTPGVTASDYQIWKNAFGQTSAAAMPGATAIPEPRALAIAIVASCWLGRKLWE